jgi:hypothetical protein
LCRSRENGKQYLTLFPPVKRAEEWGRRSSVYARLYGDESENGLPSPWPVPEPGNYLEWLNLSQPKQEIQKIRYAIKTSQPYGPEGWLSEAVAQFGLESPMRNQGRLEKGHLAPFSRQVVE